MSYYGDCPVCGLKPHRWGHRDEKQEGVHCHCEPKEKDEHDLGTFVDWRGNTVHEGDTIVYPVLHGRSAGLAIGVVDRVYAKASYNGWEPRLRVTPTERGYGSNPTKPSTLMFHDRAILLEAAK